jgi:hypothetical protein
MLVYIFSLIISKKSSNRMKIQLKYLTVGLKIWVVGKANKCQLWQTRSNIHFPCSLYKKTMTSHFYKEDEQLWLSSKPNFFVKIVPYDEIIPLVKKHYVTNHMVPKWGNHIHFHQYILAWILRCSVEREVFWGLPAHGDGCHHCRNLFRSQNIVSLTGFGTF